MSNSAQYERYEIVNAEPQVVEHDSHEARVLLASAVKLYDKRGPIQIGASCYLRRKLKGSRYYVDTGSLCEQRSQLVLKIIKSFAEGELTATTARTLPRVFGWVDQEDRASDLVSSIHSAKELYRDYTISLNQRMNISKVAIESGASHGRHTRQEGGVGGGSASRSQSGMAWILAKQHGLTVNQVRHWWPEISQRAGGRNLPVINVSTDELATAFAAHAICLQAIMEFLKSDNKYMPFRIPYSKIDGLDDVVFYTLKVNSLTNFGAASAGKGKGTYTTRYFDEDGELRPWSELESEYISENRPGSWIYYRRVSYDAFIGECSSTSQRLLINQAVRSFSSILLAATGMNPELLESIDFRKARLDHGVNAVRLIGIKNRGGGEKKEVSMPTRYLPYWRLGLELINMIEEKSGQKSEIGLCYLGRKSDQSLKTLTSQSKVFLSHGLMPPGVQKIKATDWRTFKSTTILDVSDGDTQLSSRIMGHSERTARKHYSFRRFEDSAKDMAPFFEGLGEWAVTTVQNPPTPARVIEGGHKTLSGHCDATKDDQPTLIEGFSNDGPAPACEAHTSCFFCEHYGLHADKEDIVNLLSIKAWLRLQSKWISASIDEHIEKFLPIIERVEVIIEQFKKREAASEDLLKDAELEVSAGNYSTYWKAKIDALIDAGVA